MLGSLVVSNLIEAMDRAVHYDQEGKVAADDSKSPLDIGSCAGEYIFFKDHGCTQEELQVKQTHIAPSGIRDRLAFNCVKFVRMGFDAATGWNYGNITSNMILTRTIYLETIAAVPGMVAAIVRHFYSLRNFKRDNGMMQMFLDEA
jgi:Alternative oxidase